MQKYKSTILILFIGLGLLSQAAAKTWTLGDGTTLDAEFERREINTIFLRSSDGALYKVAFEQLVLDDKMFLLDLRPADYSRSNAAARLITLNNIFGSSFIDVNEKAYGVEEFDQKMLGIFFAKNDSEACQEFLPKVKPFIEALGEQAKHFKILYLGVDENEEDFVEGFEATESDWLAVPFESSMRKKIAERFKVIEAPTFLFVNAKGKVIQEEGHLAVVDETGVLALEFKKWLETYFGNEDKASENAIVEKEE